MQQILAQVLKSAAMYLCARLANDISKEMERIERERSIRKRSKIGAVFPRAWEVIAGGRK
jgi:hypothetical protein